MEESDSKFPEADASKELNLGVPEEFPVDPISSKLETSKLRKERAEAKAKAEAAKDDDGCSCPMMSMLVVTGIAVVVVGVAFIVTKKMRAS